MEDAKASETQCVPQRACRLALRNARAHDASGRSTASSASAPVRTAVVDPLRSAAAPVLDPLRAMADPLRAPFFDDPLRVLSAAPAVAAAAASSSAGPDAEVAETSAVENVRGASRRRWLTGWQGCNTQRLHA